MYFAPLLFASLLSTEIASCHANEFENLNRETYDKVLPIYEKKERIDQRLLELATANPASKEVRTC